MSINTSQISRDMGDITAIVATHERPDALNKMISSFRNFFPGLKIIAVDSSSNPMKRGDIDHLVVSPNSGISLQRNIALDHVKSDLYLLLDDDHVCNDKTQIPLLIDGVKKGIFNIFGGAINNIGVENYLFHGDYQILGNVLYHFVDAPQESNYYDTIPNFFVGETQLTRKLGSWDENLKFAREHDDFFLNMKENKVSIGYNDKVEVDHYPYTKYHGGLNSSECIKYFLKKWNINNKVEIRLIDKDKDNIYINCHNFMINSSLPIEIENKIKSIYGNYPIIIT